jgi:hypothetical protein
MVKYIFLCAFIISLSCYSQEETKKPKEYFEFFCDKIKLEKTLVYKTKDKNTIFGDGLVVFIWLANKESLNSYIKKYVVGNSEWSRGPINKKNSDLMQFIIRALKLFDYTKEVNKWVDFEDISTTINVYYKVGGIKYMKNDGDRWLTNGYIAIIDLRDHIVMFFQNDT